MLTTNEINIYERAMTAGELDKALRNARSEKWGISLEEMARIFRATMAPEELEAIVRDYYADHDCKAPDACNGCLKTIDV